MARVSEAQTKAVGADSSSSTAAASPPDWTVSSTRWRGRWWAARARAWSSSQPARRSSPMGESLRQPIQAMRVWPWAMRCSVASRVPAAPSTSTQGWRASGAVPRAAERDERRPLLGEPGGLRVAEVGVGDDEGVDRGRAQQVVVAARPGPRRRRRRAARGARPAPRSRPACGRSGPSSRWRCPPGPARRAGRSAGRCGCAGCGRRGWASSPSPRSRSRTRSRVPGRSRSGLLTALDTVWRLTPARSATSASVGGDTGRCAPSRDSVRDMFVPLDRSNARAA